MMFLDKILDFILYVLNGIGISDIGGKEVLCQTVSLFFKLLFKRIHHFKSEMMIDLLFDILNEPAI